jgi:hypothetical protein
MGDASSKAGGTRQSQAQHSHRQGKLFPGGACAFGGVEFWALMKNKQRDAEEQTSPSTSVARAYSKILEDRS